MGALGLRGRRQSAAGVGRSRVDPLARLIRSPALLRVDMGDSVRGRHDSAVRRGWSSRARGVGVTNPQVPSRRMGLALRGPVGRTLGGTHVAPTRAGQIRVAESVRESPQNATNAANKVATLHSVFKSIRSITGPCALGGEVGRKPPGGPLCSAIALLIRPWKALVVPMWALAGRELPSIG